MTTPRWSHVLAVGVAVALVAPAGAQDRTQGQDAAQAQESLGKSLREQRTQREQKRLVVSEAQRQEQVRERTGERTRERTREHTGGGAATGHGGAHAGGGGGNGGK